MFYTVYLYVVEREDSYLICLQNFYHILDKSMDVLRCGHADAVLKAFSGKSSFHMLDTRAASHLQTEFNSIIQ